MSASLRFPGKKTVSTFEKGRSAESIAAAYLQNLGYHILKRNLYTPFGEIDILAKQGSEFVCVEVRSRLRKDGIPPELTVSQRKYRHLVRSLLSLPFLHNRPVRIDLITLEAQKVRLHIQNFSLS